MLYLLLTVAFTAIIFVLFKLFTRYEVDNANAININYLTAFLLGSAIEGRNLIGDYFDQSWFWASAILGFLFVSLFILLARVVQHQGMSIAVLANKMSLVIPSLLAILILGETFDWIKGLGIIAALVGIALTLYQANSPLLSRLYSGTIILFVGSGILDFLLKVSQQFLISDDEFFAFVALVFFWAFVFGMFYTLWTKTSKWNRKNIIGGIVLGVPNYFSIFFLMQTLDVSDFGGSFVFPVNNASVLIVTSFLGFLFFKEKLNAINWIGLGTCVAGIVLIANSLG